MAELSCPHCQNVVRLPRVEANTRYLCKQCYTPFYMNTSGKTVAGEPPHVDEEVEALKRKVREKLDRAPTGRIVAGAAVLLVVALAAYFLLRPAQRIEEPAEEAAQALAAGDRDTLQGFAAPGTAEDVGRWFDAVHPRLVAMRAGWHERDEAAEAHIGAIDPEQHTTTVALSVHPVALGMSRDVAIADPTAATAAAAGSFDVETVWTQNRWGRWQIDGRRTYARAAPEPAPAPAPGPTPP